jgi:hypothetical protein
MALINSQRFRRYALAGLIAMLAGLFIGGHQPWSANLVPEPWDKLAHFAVYGGLTLLIGIAFPRIRLLLLVCIILAIGSADELHQIFVPGRHPGLDDLIADLIGSLPSLFAVTYWRSRNNQPHASRPSL